MFLWSALLFILIFMSDIMLISISFHWLVQRPSFSVSYYKDYVFPEFSPFSSFGITVYHFFTIQIIIKIKREQTNFFFKRTTTTKNTFLTQWPIRKNKILRLCCLHLIVFHAALSIAQLSKGPERSKGHR